MNDGRISNQIAVYKTNKKLCEFNDKLKPAPIDCYAHTHAQGEELPDGSRPRSVVGIVLQDYSKGTGPNTIRVVANLSPGFFSYALSRVSIGVEAFEFDEEKIFGNPDDKGLCTVTKVSVRRASVGKDGKPRNYPWYICVENGRAVKEKTATGGFHMKSGTYAKDRVVFININDYDFFQLMNRVTRYIEIWELTTGPKLVRDASKLLDAQRQQANEERGM
jgi:hypothetical protein